MKKLLIVFFAILAISNCTFGQAKYDKMLKKVETAYEAGSYESASSALEKFKKKATKKLGAQNGYMPTYYLYRAKNDLSSGMIYEFESNLKAAESSSISINQENSLKNGILLLDAADLHIQGGSFRTAKRYLERSRKVLETGGFITDPLKARLDLSMAEVMNGQGFYNEALELLYQQERFFAGRAIKQESYVDDKGNLKSRRLPEEELNVRYSDYARLLTNIANVFRGKGNFKSADSAFASANTWIDKNLGESKIPFVRNQFYWSNLIVEGGLEADQSFPRGLGFDRALNNLKIAHKPSHFLAIEIYEQYLKRLLLEGNSSRYSNTKLEFEKMINKNFPSASIYNARLKAVEFDSRLSKDKTRNLETDAKKLITSKGLPRNNITTAEISDFLFELSQENKNYKNSEGYLKDIIEIKSELLGEEAPEVHLAKVHLANFYLDYTNSLLEAGKIYEESFTKVVEKQIDPSHKDHLDILNHLAVYYELTDKYTQAISSLDKASDVARGKYSDSDYQYGAELTNIARLQIKLGQYEKAEENISLSLKILEEFRKEESKQGYLVNAIETEATLFGIKGLFDEATDALNRSAKIIDRAQGHLVGVDELSTAKELSSLLIQLGRYTDTEKLLDGLILEYEKLYGPNSLRLIEPLVNKGRLTLLKGDYTEADRIALRANQIALSIYTEKSTKTAPTQRLLSDIDYTIGDYDKAEDNIQKALASQEKQFGRNHIEVAKSISQLALIKFYKGDDRKVVEKLMLESRDIMGAKLGKENPQYAEILKNVAIVYISEKRYDIAFNSLTVAESIWKTKTGRKNNINLASIYTLTGDVFYQQKKYEKAEEFYSKSKKLYEDFFSKTHPEYVKVLSKQAKVYYMEKDFKRSKRNIEEALSNYENFIKLFFPALSEREKAKYWNTIKGDFEFYNTLAFSQLEDFRDLSGKVYNYQLLTKALLLSSSIKIRERILNSKDETLITNYTDWLQKKETLTNALSMSAQQLAENEIDPVALGNEVEKIEKELSEKSELFGQNFENKKITYENVQKSIGKNDVAIEMIRYRHFDHTFTDSIIYVALYVKSDNARPKVVELSEGHRMETRFLNYYRNCITGKIPDNVSYKVFWEPIQKEIGQYSTIFLSPDGVYNQINLEAIPTPDGKYIIDNSNIVIISNTKDLYLRKIKAKTASATNTASMFGNPTFYLSASASNNIPSLPGTELEVNELQDLLKQKGWTTDKFVEKNATEEHVKELMNPKIFHIATHGFYTPSVDKDEATELTESETAMEENPLLKTGLLLKGAGDVRNKSKYNYNIESGILTAYEAMSLNLDQTDLVVLSACETGLGDISNGEGVYGLQRAFLVAGAKTLIMSMFKVDDVATQKLILSFYKKWLASGNLRKSFVDAKVELRIEYPEPYYWGTFMMIGLD